MEWEYKSSYIALIFKDDQSPDDLVKPVGRCLYLWQEILQTELNKLGRDGWELVAIDPRLVEGSGIDGFAIFKRQKTTKVVVRKKTEAPWDPRIPPKLTPSFHGRECLGNGEWPGYECCCDECDHYLACFPEQTEGESQA